MGTLGNANHDIIIVGYWIFDSKYEKALCLEKNNWIQYALLLLAKNKLQNLNQYFKPLATCGHQLILKLDKHEEVSKMTTHKKSDKNEENNYIYIQIFDNYIINNYI